jgi:hypothetical protein
MGKGQRRRTGGAEGAFADRCERAAKQVVCPQQSDRDENHVCCAPRGLNMRVLLKSDACGTLCLAKETLHSRVYARMAQAG